MAKTGRKRVSGVWKYFQYDESTKMSTCLLSIGENNCEEKVKGKFPTNLKGHLKKKHPEEFKILEEEARKEREAKDKAVSKASSSTSTNQRQISIAESFVARKKYDTSSVRYESVTKKLAIFVGATNVPLNLVERAEFCDLITALDCRYSVPGRRRISTKIDQLVIELKANISALFQKSRLINICADIWSKKGMTASFMGVTAHFFTTFDHQRHNITIAVRRMPSPHTADAVAEIVSTVLSEWKIPDFKVHRILTDNGSNMIAAFKEQLETAVNDEEENDVSISQDEEMDDVSICSEEESDSEETDDEEDELNHTDTMDYERCEDMHNIAFVGYKRTSCFVHTLQLVVQVFDEFSFSKKVMKKVRKLVKKVNKSVKATEMLIAKAGRKLVSNCPTRWSSTFLMICRLLEVKQHITVVLEELGWDNLPNSHWRMIESMVQLLRPFAQYTTLTNAEESTTISLVIPVLLELDMHLEDMKKCSGIIQVAKKMHCELNRRFEIVTNPSAVNFDPIYVTATLLHPGYRDLLLTSQVEAGKAHLLEIAKQLKPTPPSADADTNQAEQNDQPASSLQETDPPQPKRFKHITLLLAEKRKQQAEDSLSLRSEEEIELDMYLSSDITMGDDEDPLQFWTSNTTFKHLSLAAQDILAVPASSAPVERVFSTAGEATTGKRNRLTDSNLEREVFLRQNRKYL